MQDLPACFSLTEPRSPNAPATTSPDGQPPGKERSERKQVALCLPSASVSGVHLLCSWSLLDPSPSDLVYKRGPCFHKASCYHTVCVVSKTSLFRNVSHGPRGKKKQTIRGQNTKSSGGGQVELSTRTTPANRHAADGARHFLFRGGGTSCRIRFTSSSQCVCSICLPLKSTVADR